MTSAVSGRTALVTGAGNGLGRAMSLALAEAGARVLLVGRDRAKLDGSTELVPSRAGGPGCRLRRRDPASVEALRASWRTRTSRSW
jgi:NAD(P)-dependent dehydrogenase (short-subunit alcohol dehydrogenase family)